MLTNTVFEYYYVFPMTKKLNLVPVTHKKMRERGQYVTINSNGFTFSADAIRENQLEDKNSVVVLQDKDDPYLYAFKFHDENSKDVSSSLKLIHPNTSRGAGTATRQCSAVGVINSSKSLKAIRDLEEKTERTFEFKAYDKKECIYYIELIPSFEFTIEFSEIKDLSDEISGIYRCYDQYDQVVYIGSGLIRNEAINAQKKSQSQFKHIDYSIINDRNSAYGWERHYQVEFEKKYGELPRFNKILAPERSISKIGAI